MMLAMVKWAIRVLEPRRLNEIAKQLTDAGAMLQQRGGEWDITCSDTDDAKVKAVLDELVKQGRIGWYNTPGIR